MERLRTRVSPIPSSSSNVFPTVLEEPVTPSDEHPDSVGSRSGGSGKSSTEFCTVGESPTESSGSGSCNGISSNGQHMFRKHRRRLPLVQPISRNSRSSRSFDSGISCLLTSSEPGSPGPDHIGSPNHISSRQSYISSPCNSPGPRSPRLGMVRNPLSPRPHVPGGFCGFFPRRFSEQIESYHHSTKSSDDSDSSPPTTEPSPPPNGSSSSPPPTSPILRVSRRTLPETPKSPYNLWQQSRDSLDSGVYSRSTTCESFPGRASNNSSGSPVLSSTSPPTLTRHSWRRGVARLPEPPVNNQHTNSQINKPHQQLQHQTTIQQIADANEEHKRIVHFDAINNQSSSATPCSTSSSTLTTTSNLIHQQGLHQLPHQHQLQQQGVTLPPPSTTPSPVPGSPARSQRSLSLLTSLKNTYQAKIDHSPVKTGTGILNKLHEKLAATRSSPVSGSSVALSNLEVPKLRDLKSHSFPPIPFTTNCSNTTSTNENTTIETQSDTYYNPITQALVNQHYPIDHSNYYCYDTEETESYIVKLESTDDRRRKWLLASGNHDGDTYNG